MNSTEIESEVARYLIDECGMPEELRHDDALFSSGMMSSIDMVSLVTYLESQFSITIPPTEVSLERLDSVQSISKFVSTRLPG